jgi:signal transduction histidine kinase/ActR/RegA family two-component response regulator
VVEKGTAVEAEQEIRLRKKPQSYLSNKFPLRDANGTVYAVCGVLTDVTEQKLLGEQLRQAQKLESLGTLAGGIAHDFNNILGIILGHASILKPHQEEPKKLQESVDSITKAVQRGTNLVRQLLTFARKTDVLFESVNLNAVVEELVRMLRATFPKNIEFSLQLDPDLPLVTADANQLHQALLNLSVNARDVMPQGGTLSLSTSVVPGTHVNERFAEAIEEHYVRVGVGDTGSGMDEQTKKRIFEPFFTTKGIGRGTGLGLAVVYGVVNSHHGFVDFESEMGRGTTFHLYFPVAKGEIAGKEPLVQEPAEISGGDEVILVVEDEEALVALLNQMLRSKGYHVLTAADGVEALEIYKQQADEIALVLTDLGLPRLGGWDLVKEIRKVNPRTKIVVASGYFDPNARSEMIRAGALDFVQKPYVPQEVLKRVRQVIDGHV